jgi:hypothetical protein
MRGIKSAVDEGYEGVQNSSPDRDDAGSVIEYLETSLTKRTPR